MASKVFVLWDIDLTYRERKKGEEHLQKIGIFEGTKIVDIDIKVPQDFNNRNQKKLSTVFVERSILKGLRKMKNLKFSGEERKGEEIEISSPLHKKEIDDEVLRVFTEIVEGLEKEDINEGYKHKRWGLILITNKPYTTALENFVYPLKYVIEKGKVRSPKFTFIITFWQNPPEF